MGCLAQKIGREILHVESSGELRPKSGPSHTWEHAAHVELRGLSEFLQKGFRFSVKGFGSCVPPSTRLHQTCVLLQHMLHGSAVHRA